MANASGPNAAGEDGAKSAPSPALRSAPNRDPRKRRRWFSLVGELTPLAFAVVAASVFLALFVLWSAATAFGLVQPLFLPSPAKVASRLWLFAVNGQLWQDAQVSLYRISIGFLAASILGIPGGVLIGSYRVLDAAVEPLVDFIRYMPVVAFVPLTILWTGTGDLQKLLIIWIGTFFQQILMVKDNVKRVPAEFIDVGRTLQMPEWKILLRIVIPAAAPGIWDTLRITLGWAWTWLVLAELVAATSGLGYRITVAQRFFQTDTIIGYILVLGCLGLVTDQVMKALERRFFVYLRGRR